VSITGGPFTYNGQPHAATVVLNPAIAGYSVNYTGSTTAYNSPNAPANADMYTVTVTITNSNYVLSGTGTGSITINKAEATVTAAGNTCTYSGSPCAGNGSAFGVNGEPLTPVTLAYATTPAPGNLLTSAPVNAAVYQVAARFAGNANYNHKQSAPATITIKAATSTVAITPPAPAQYSDSIALSATVTPGTVGGSTQTGSLEFFINGASVSTSVGVAAINSSGVATLASVANFRVPGNYTVSAKFTSTNPNFTDASESSPPLSVMQEDARATYTGALFASTASATSTSATVTLSATIQDITAVTGDLAYDSYPGDIRNATVTFINRDTNAVIATVPVGLADLNDKKTGTATYNWSASIGSCASSPCSATFTIGVIVNNYYTRNSSADNTVVTVAQPGNNFITGGGYLVLTSSGGQKAGDSGKKNNFGFNVKYNKTGTNLQGNINTIIRRTEPDGVHVYQIKGNSMTSLSVDATTGKATFNGKASIQDITNPLVPLSVDGNATLQVTMTDAGEPGSSDKIAITVWNKAGGLWFASNWSGTGTVEQLLGGGNLIAH